MTAADTLMLDTVGTLDGMNLGACFNQALNQASAENIANYSVNGGAIPVVSARLRDDQQSVRLRLAGPLAFGPFTLLATNIVGLQNNVGGGVVNGLVPVYVLAAADLGDPMPTGAVFSCESGAIDITAGGAGMWNDRDQFTFVSRALTGDFDVWAHVIPGASPAGALGVLAARESANIASARSLGVFLTPDPNIPPNYLQASALVRCIPGTNSEPFGIADPADLSPSNYFRLQRVGNIFTTFLSQNAVTWKMLGQTNTSANPFAHTLFVGFGAASLSLNQTATVEFRDVMVTQPSCIMLSCPPDFTVACTNPAGTVVTYSPFATNPCDPTNLVVECLPPSGSEFLPGVTTVYCTARNSNEFDWCSFDVTVQCQTTPVKCSGFIVDAAGRPATGFQVTAAGTTRESTLTDTNGHYEFQNLLRGGDYQIVPVRPGHLFTPPQASFQQVMNDLKASFVVTTPFELWQGSVFPPNTPPNMMAPGADPDGDLKVNALEYVFATDPNQPEPDSGFRMTLLETNGSRDPVLQLPAGLHLDDAELIMEITDDFRKGWRVAGSLLPDPEFGGAVPLWLPYFGENTPIDDPVTLLQTPLGWGLRLSPPADFTEPAVFVRWRVVGVGSPPGSGDSGSGDCAGAMSNRKNASLLVGFQNFQRLPILAREYFAPENSPYGYLSDKEAATRLAARVIKGNYDIIAFAEVWTEDAKNTLERQLKHAYPYYVKKLDCGPFQAEWQDSGLMLFSRLPFAELPGGPRYCEENLAFACGDRSHDVEFIRYGSRCSDGGDLGERVQRILERMPTDPRERERWLLSLPKAESDLLWDWMGAYFEGDCRANKGAGIVQVHDPLAARDYTIVFTHLQAHHGSPDQDEARSNQVELIHQKLTDIYGTPPLPHSVLMLGDFNINGDLMQDDFTPPVGGVLQPRNEWYLRLADPGSWWGQNFTDTWEHQSLNENVSLDWRDRGLTDGSQGNSASPGANSRFDYLLYHTGVANRLAVQHMARALNLQYSIVGDGLESPAAFGTAGRRLLTDHHGIVAYVHPNVDPTWAGASPNNAPAVIQPPDLGPNEAVSVNATLQVAGEFKWFLLPEPGVYSVGVTPSSFTNEVFTTDDLSTPAMDAGSYRDLAYTDGFKHLTNRCLTYVSPNRPLFVRVRHTDPQGFGPFTLVVREHQCLSREDLCVLQPNGPLQTNTWTSAPGSAERWYLLATEAADSGNPQRLRVHGESNDPPGALGYQFELYDADGTTPASDDVGNPISPWSVTSTNERQFGFYGGDNLWLRVFPVETARPRSLLLGWSTDLTVVMTNCPSNAGTGVDADVVNDLVISSGTDSGIWEHEENVEVEGLLSFSPATLVHRPDTHPGHPVSSAPDPIRSRWGPVRLVNRIRPGQHISTGAFLYNYRFLTNEFLNVFAVEDDNPCPGVCYSYLQGRVEALSREDCIHPGANTRLSAEEDPGEEYYTLRLNLSHGARWLQFGR
jgi:hypothetical protein